ncbi:MAG: hypothetical protein ACI9TH_004229 [Kiritimatiellia bacterium]|jgi:hypothetical protein
MLHEKNYLMAGYGFRYFTRDPSIQLNLQKRYEPFEVEHLDNPDGCYEFVRQDAVEHPPADPARCFMDCENWQFGLTTDDRVYMNSNYVLNEYWHPVALVDGDFREGYVFPRMVDAETDFIYSTFFPNDEQLLLNRIGKLGGGLVHCSGMNYKGKVYLFCGKSGAGKSTTAALWQAQGHTLLNDDRMIIRMLDGQAVSGPSPWHGSIPDIHPEVLPLGGVFHLEQARENRATPMPLMQGVGRLMANCIAPFNFKDSMSRIMDTFGQVLETTPSWRLDFTPDERAYHAAVAAIEGP